MFRINREIPRCLPGFSGRRSFFVTTCFVSYVMALVTFYLFGQDFMLHFGVFDFKF